MTQVSPFNLNDAEKEMGYMSDDNDIRAITHTQPTFRMKVRSYVSLLI